MVTHSIPFAGNAPSFGGLVAIDHFFEITAVNITTGQPVEPNVPYTITVQYAEVERGPVIENTLALYYWVGSHWRLEPTSTVDVINNTVTATPNHFSLWAVLGSSHQVHLPLVGRNWVSAPDLRIVAIEATQGIQDLENSVPLVADRATVVRIFAVANGSKPVNDVFVTLEAWRDGLSLPGSPLTIGPWALFWAWRGNYGSSINVLLPSSWLSGNVTLLATVDPNDLVRESDEENNELTLTRAFNSVPPLDLKIVPINYTDEPTGHFFPAPPSEDIISRWIMGLFPLSSIEVSFRTPIDYDGDLSTRAGWEQLLRFVSDIKMADGAPSSQVYYGFVPTTNESGDQYHKAVSGVGYLGQRVSIGTHSGQSRLEEFVGGLAAHEIGHNFGRLHSCCGNAPDVDPYYPYADGSIGEYGVDIATNQLFFPFTADLMSLCGPPTWISDYTYQALFDDQISHGLRSTSSRVSKGLLIRARFDAEGIPFLMPVYVVADAPTNMAAPGDYSVELLDSLGNVIASHAVSMYRAEEDSVVSNAIYGIVPLPDQSVVGLKLVRAGKSVAERVLGPYLTNTLTALSVDQLDNLLALRWGYPEIPALVRYTVDDGKSWTTLGLDVLGGELIVDRNTLSDGTGFFEVRFADVSDPVVLTWRQ